MYAAASGVLALECLKKDIEYTGLCYTDAHMRELIDHLSDLVFREMLDSESPLRDSSLATLLSTSKAPTPKKPKTNKTEPEDLDKPPKTPKKSKTDNMESPGKTDPEKSSAGSAEKPGKKQELLDILKKVKDASKNNSGDGDPVLDLIDEANVDDEEE